MGLTLQNLGHSLEKNNFSPTFNNNCEMKSIYKIMLD